MPKEDRILREIYRHTYGEIKTPKVKKGLRELYEQSSKERRLANEALEKSVVAMQNHDREKKVKYEKIWETHDKACDRLRKRVRKEYGDEYARHML